MSVPEFERLIEILMQLLGPEGCPWDREQTMLSIRSSVVEEACELKEAIEAGDNHHICEELGDLFLNAVFLAKLAEKENRFTMDDALNMINQKLIRRHPHVFGKIKIDSSIEVKNQWEEIKKAEKGKEHRLSALDSIPAGLPIMHRAQKVIKKMTQANFPLSFHQENHSEEELADKMLALLLEAQIKEIDLELALREKLKALENDFRHYETK